MLVEGGMYGNYTNVFVRSGIATRGNVHTIFFLLLLCSVLSGTEGVDWEECVGREARQEERTIRGKRGRGE